MTEGQSSCTGLDDPEARFTFVECRVQGTTVNGQDGKLIACGTAMPKGGCTLETGKRLIGENFNAQ